MEIEPIAYFRSPFGSKFGIPKQSGLVGELRGRIVFVDKYRSADAIRGIEDFDFLWLVWGFSANRHSPASLLVRPPLLGGNAKVGVFASRSPFRPNGLGLSSVRLAGVVRDGADAPYVEVLGADLMDGTPIYDVKPYLTYADCHPGARSGFVDTHAIRRLKVVMPESLRSVFGAEELAALRKTLELDPRPQYHHSPEKRYGLLFGGHDVHFTVDGDTLTVLHIDS